MISNPQTVSSLLVAVVVLPLVAAAALAAPRVRPAVLVLAPFSALPALALALFAPSGSVVEIPWLFKHTILLLDDTGRVFLGFTGVLYVAAAWYARNYLRGDPVIVRFFIFLLLAMAGNFGLIVAGDIPTFFAAFAVMGLCSAGLVSHRIDDETRRASRLYLALTMIGEVVVLTGLSLLIVDNETTVIAELHGGGSSPIATLLVLVGFGIKAGALTLHFWLPLAHPAAPIPASAVLSGTMIKAGLLGWIRFLPLGDSAEPALGVALIAAGLGAALLGAIAGVVQANPKTVLAYSSVCQMGIIMTGLGIGAIRPDAWPEILPAVLIYTTHHALAKGALFLGIGPASGAVGRREVLIARLGMVFPALALAGAPLTSGAVAKTALKSHLVSLPEGWAWAVGLLVPIAAIGTTAMMIRVLTLVWPPRPDAEKHSTDGLWAPWLALVGAVAVGVWMLPGSLDWLLMKLSPGKIWLALWPLLAGGALAAAGNRIRRLWTVDPSRWIPPGDIGVLVGGFMARVVRDHRSPSPPEGGHEYCDESTEVETALDSAVDRFGRGLGRLEESLASWSTAGVALGVALGLLGWYLIR
ncbi:MAG: complex I subunit 5 family protein [Thermoanaerobaculales bacterium]|jgi:formate hydrogenlyase subunit 3/multisubunit Na+/H+ antiporter MnhD subunit|nr:complex I subunit 5 family protein [Thermoanaerobaculales bacterium]